MERHPIFAAVYDSLMAPLDRFWLAPLRRRTAEAAEGRTLEIGAGTGLNFPLFRSARPLVGLEPDPEMIRRAKPRAVQSSGPVHLVVGSAEALPFRDGAFDSVVASLVFCTIPDADRAAREVRRVLRPGSGVLHFFEHVRAAGRGLAAFQDAILPGWKKLFAGCHPNRATLPVFESAGFRVESCEQHGPILVVGSARPDAAIG